MKDIHDLKQTPLGKLNMILFKDCVTHYKGIGRLKKLKKMESQGIKTKDR